MLALPPSTLDAVLTLQIVVAWAGEGLDTLRLGWWRTDMADEFGGEDLLRRLTPETWRWGVLETAREAARRADAASRGRDHDPDQLVSLFRFGFEIDEKLGERLAELKRTEPDPLRALPGLTLLADGWSREAFEAWVDGHGAAGFAEALAGRRLKNQPEALDLAAQRLVAALKPLGSEWSGPHFRREA